MARDKRRSSAAEAARRRALEHTSEFARTSLEIPSGANMFSIKKPGSYRIDILPYKVGKGNPYADEGTLHYERTYWVHRGVGADEDTYVCPAKTAKKPCPICEYRAKLERDSNADEELIRALAPKERQLFNVVDLAAQDRGVQIWDNSYHLFGKLLDSRIRNADDDEDFARFCELEGGLTLKLTAEEKSMGKNKFCDVTSIDFKPRKDDYTEEWLDACYCLDDIVKVLDYDSLRKIFLQTADVDEEELESDDDAPAKPTGRRLPPKAPAKKAVVEEEAEPEEEEPVAEYDDIPFDEDPVAEDDDIPFEEEEEEPTPKKPTAKAPAKPARKQPEPELEEEEPEPEEEEPEPEPDLEEEETPQITKGMRVSFKLGGKPVEGEVTSTPPNTTKVQVTTDDGKRWNVEKARLTVVKASKPAKPTGGKKCPAGGTFGKDTDELEECAGCELWDECDNAKYPPKK